MENETPPSFRMVRYTETARERELFRYYQPTEHPSPDHNRDAAAQSSSDTALTAFAQLGALRLNATRCIISLVGSKTEYILAEASKTLSLHNDDTHEPGDQLLHGSGAMAARSEIGRVLISLLTGDPKTKALESVVVKDIYTDERFTGLDTTEMLGVRSLVCLPLRSARGYVIGLYCVFDVAPREKVSEVEIQFVKDMTATTMDHIEAGRVRQRHDRAEKMVKALALYLDGGESLKEWWLNQATDGRNIQQPRINERNRRGCTLTQQADVEFGIQDGPDDDMRSITSLDELQGDSSRGGSYTQSTATYSVASVSEREPPPVAKRTGTSSMGTTTAPSDPPTNINPTSTQSESFTVGSTPPIAETKGSKSSLAIRNFEQEMNLPGKELQEALLSADVKKSFSRASNLIREAIDLDGVAFYDASVGSFGAGSSKESMDQKAPGAYTQDSIPETTTSDTSDSQNSRRSNHKDELAMTSASILGYSTRTRSSLKNHADSERLGAFSEPLLRKMAKRYPHGKVFNFEDDGSISSSDVEGRSALSDSSGNFQPKRRASGAESEARKAKKLLSREAEAAAILEVIPGARSVAWFPLWDSASERWYAGALIWSMTPARVLSAEDELTYMAAWGNSIMAEVSRLSALVAARMKVDFVSSISHELRSPLHGILATVEFLQEERLPDMHADMIHTIHSCGKTLLDTINHVLEFAKVTKKPKSTTRVNGKRPRGPYRSLTEKANVEEVSDICILAEEVIDSVYAGRRLTKANHSKNPVVVILDISCESNWEYKINVGALRRVLMNLFSNAVKYTNAGFVKVSVSLEHKPSSQEGKSHPILHITVKDSGKGISREFLRDHLYSAFKQEDALSVGTGLGLSIVRQILLDVRGTIEIESELRAGTKASVSVPLRSSNSRLSDARPGIVADVRKRLRGRRARIVNEGFNVYPEISDVPTGILTPESQAMIYLKSSIETTLTGWFDMEIKHSSENEMNRDDVVVMMASDDIDDKIASLDEGGPKSEGQPVVIALCDASYRGANFTTESGTSVFYLRLPVTPHKLGNILHSAFCKSTSGPSTSSPLQPSSTSKPSPPEKGILHNLSSAQGILPAIANTPPTNSRTRPHLPRSPSRIKSYTSTTFASPTMSIPPNTFRTLLVEDNAINLKLLAQYMTKLSQPHVTATNGLEAIAAYKDPSNPKTHSQPGNQPHPHPHSQNQHRPFDIIFMDLQMPTMDGLQAAKEIRRYEHEMGWQPAAVVALTGAASMSARQEAFSSGMDLFLVKPVAMRVLRDVLVELHERGRGALREFG